MDLSLLFRDLGQGFVLGNAAILTNACLLPLYPGLIAFLAGNTAGKEKQSSWATGLLGVLVLAGILTTMIGVGVGLSLLSLQFGDVLPLLLPVIYLLVIGMGVLMLRGYNPFAKLQTSQAPMLRNRYLTAYVYGLFFGPMTLPCTGPIILSAVAISTSSVDLASSFLYFLAFGLGFGWPLVVLPWFAMPLQRRVVGWLAQNHEALTRASGFLLVAVGVFGILTELLPQIVVGFELGQAEQLMYWGVALLLTVLVGYRTVAYQSEMQAVAS